MILEFFTADGCEAWAVSRRPLRPVGMPFLLDDDLLLHDDEGQRPTTVVNQWLRELPSSGCPAPNTWMTYARVLRAWLVFLAAHDISPFDDRETLRNALSGYVVFRTVGPMKTRLGAASWNLHVSVLSRFYTWAVEENHAEAVPFTFRVARHLRDGEMVQQRINLARRRQAKRHVTIKYLDDEFATLFLRALEGLGPDGTPDEMFHGRELGRNAAIGSLAMSTGLRLSEFTHLLIWEIPPLPPRPTHAPISFSVPASIAKGSKPRETWISYNALVRVHRYLDLDRPAAATGSSWLPRSGPALHVTNASVRGGRVNGTWVRWDNLVPEERLRLVNADGGSAVLSLKSDGGPFTAWNTVFARTAARIAARFEPRFPHISAHRLRHTFAMRTLGELSSGYYQQAALAGELLDRDAGLACYLSKTDPMMVLRDLLGHVSVATTEIYTDRLGRTLLFPATPAESTTLAGDEHEADSEFDDEIDHDGAERGDLVALSSGGWV